MDRDIDNLLEQNRNLILANNNLDKQLREATEIIRAITKGKVDAVFMSGQRDDNLLVSKKADQTYRNFIENMSEGVLTLQSDGLVLYCNSSFAQAVDLPIEKIVGIDFRHLIKPPYVEIFGKYFGHFPETNVKEALAITDASGTEHFYIVSVNTIRLQDLMALSLVLTDITKQKIAENGLLAVNKKLSRSIKHREESEEKIALLNEKLNLSVKILQRANTELSTFAQVASHDLHEPLRKIVTYSSMMLKFHSINLNQEGQRYLGIMQKASERMICLIHDILEYSALSKEDEVPQPTDMKKILEHVFFNLETSIKETNAVITLEGVMPVILSNHSQMVQLFQNLIGNALKFRNADIAPHVVIFYERVPAGHDLLKSPGLNGGDFHRFKVSDNGIGFDQQYGEKIFTVFQKLNNGSRFQGTGIGLAICKKIVEKYNGTIRAEGILQRGATFTIMLPLT